MKISKKIYHGRKTKAFKKPESDLPVISLPITDMEDAKRIAKRRKGDRTVTSFFISGGEIKTIEVWLNDKKLLRPQWRIIKGKDGEPDSIKILGGKLLKLPHRNKRR